MKQAYLGILIFAAFFPSPLKGFIRTDIEYRLYFLGATLVLLGIFIVENSIIRSEINTNITFRVRKKFHLVEILDYLFGIGFILYSLMGFIIPGSEYVAIQNDFFIPMLKSKRLITLEPVSLIYYFSTLLIGLSLIWSGLNSRWISFKYANGILEIKNVQRKLYSIDYETVTHKITLTNDFILLEEETEDGTIYNITDVRLSDREIEKLAAWFSRD